MEDLTDTVNRWIILLFQQVKKTCALWKVHTAIQVGMKTARLCLFLFSGQYVSDGNFCRTYLIRRFLKVIHPFEKIIPGG